MKRWEDVSEGLAFFRVSNCRVVDGDTVIADISLPFGVKLSKERIRFLGVNTPERGQAGFEKAKAFTAEFLEHEKTRTLWLFASHRRQDKYGRVLGWLAVGDNPWRRERMKSLSHVLVAQGLGEVYSGG